MKRSNAQYTWFLIYLTEQSLFTLYRMWRHQIIAAYPCKHQSLCEATISVLGMIRRILGKQIILQTSTLVTTEEPHRCYSDNHLHFFIRLLLYSFRGVRFFGAWLAGVPCQKAIVILSILDIAKCQWMDPALDRLFRVPGSVISPNFMVLGCVLCEKWED